MPQHRQQTEADQMRNPLFVGLRGFMPQLTAEHPGRGQRGRRSALRQRIPPKFGCLAKQIAGFPISAYELRHIVPRLPAIPCSTSLAGNSFCFAARALYALAHIWPKLHIVTQRSYTGVGLGIARAIPGWTLLRRPRVPRRFPGEKWPTRPHFPLYVCLRTDRQRI